MERNFNKIYEEIYKESNELLSNLRNKNNIKIAIIIIMILVFWYLIFFKKIANMISITTMFIIFVLIFVLIIRGQIKYKAIFKVNVIKKMVNLYSDKLSYSSMGGITKQEYNQSQFDIKYDKLYVEDCVVGVIGEATTLKMSQVITKRKETYVDSDGHRRTKYVTTFSGMYGIVKLERPSFTNIDILRNANFVENFFRKRNYKKENRIFIKPPLHFKIIDKDKVEIDSAEFEKYYDFYATDKIMALRIVTAELIEKFIEIKNKDKRWLEIRINNDMLYFRYKCGDIFEPTALKDALDFNTLHKTFNILDIPIGITEEIVEHIKSVEI